MSITINTKVYNWAQFDQNGVSRYIESSAATPTGFSPLTNGVGGSGKTKKVKWRVAIPTVATVDTGFDKAGSILRTAYLNIELDVDETSTLAERQDIRLRGKDLFSNAQFIASFDNLVQASS
jgi:hypothetical protein